MEKALFSERLKAIHPVVKVLHRWLAGRQKFTSSRNFLNSLLGQISSTWYVREAKDSLTEPVVLL